MKTLFFKRYFVIIILATGLVSGSFWAFALTPPMPQCAASSLARVGFGQSSLAVKNLQSCLINIGFLIPAGPTGFYGSQTDRAVKEFYSSIMGISANWRYIGPQGVVTLRNLAALGRSVLSDGVKKISSEEELRLYLNQAQKEKSSGGITGGILGAPRFKLLGVEDVGLPLPMSAPSSAETAQRVSETNVQVAGVDEPDIVKTDGENIFFSESSIYYGGIRPLPLPFVGGGTGVESLTAPYPYQNPNTKVIKAFPPASLMVKSDINASGDLLLVKDKKILVIFSNQTQEIIGYDTANPAAPSKKWTAKLEGNSLPVTSRLYGGKVYVVIQQNINYSDPCPISVMSLSANRITIPCYEMYRPVKVLPVDVTFNAFILDPSTGQIEKKISFLGSSSYEQSVVYMSTNALYIAYSYPESFTKIFIQFLSSSGNALFPQDIVDKIKKLETYDLSEAAKSTEINVILSQYENSLVADERLKYQNELQNKFSSYLKVHQKDLEKTTIVKVPLNTFAVGATGVVPGSLLNQFSLDEYNGYLRSAVTMGERWWGGWGFGSRSGESMNAVYVLDIGLKTVGQVEGLGKGERIYSARFIGDKGYIVTFRQIDPFYVIDLSNPQSPALKGELKIPGYSAYLQPITEDKILGVGQEGSQVKVSLFDVANPASPVEKDKYILSDTWTEVSNNHRAFLLDTKHQIFFLPGSQGGYVFSYVGDKLTLKKAVSDYAVKRAVYLDDFLYIIGENKITVFNELTWSQVSELNLIKLSPTPSPSLSPVPILYEYLNKVVYTMNVNADIESYQNDCDSRGGTFNQCGTVCESSAEACIGVCALTCEF